VVVAFLAAIGSAAVGHDKGGRTGEHSQECLCHTAGLTLAMKSFCRQRLRTASEGGPY